MSEFINTIDVLGDDVVIDSIIDRTITEFKDDKLTKVGAYAFHGCSVLETVDMPSVLSIGTYAFENCVALKSISFPNATTVDASAFAHPLNAETKLEEVSLPLVTTLGSGAFRGNTHLKRVILPMVNKIDSYTFQWCKELIYVDLGSVTSIHQMQALSHSSNTLKALLIRTNSVCTLGDNIGIDNGYIYVPRALVDSYKAATNWSTHADQFRALEGYTVDGTTSGKFAAGLIHYNLQYVSSSNTETFVMGSYRTTLTVLGDNPFVSVTMDGVDITTDVYNSETHEIVIPQVVGDVVITATSEFDMDASIIYNLPAPTTFNGTSDYIDTGIKLFDTPKDFTIVCSADFSALGSNICLLHCMNEASPYPGLCVDGNSGVRICYTGASALSTSITNKNNVSALALRFKAGVLDAIHYKDASGNVVTVVHNTAATYMAITQNLLLGAYQTTAGTKGRYYKGTIKSFMVFGESLADELITIVLQTA